MRAFRFATTAASRAPARNGSRIGQMRLAVPAGLIGTALDRVRITITGWSVRNDGSVDGYVGGRLLLQLAWKAAGIPIREDTIIDGGWAENLPVTERPRGRLLYSGLKAITSTTDPRRLLVWDPTPYRVWPGGTVEISFNLLIGIDLLAGMTDIDIVAIVERLPEVKTLKGGERRWPDAFSVAELPPPAPAGFSPVLMGTAVANVFPF